MAAAAARHVDPLAHALPERFLPFVHQPRLGDPDGHVLPNVILKFPITLVVILLPSHQHGLDQISVGGVLIEPCCQ